MGIKNVIVKAGKGLTNAISKAAVLSPAQLEEIRKKKQQIAEEQQKQQEELRRQKQRQMLDKSQEYVLLNDLHATEEEYDDLTAAGKRPEVNILICIVTFILAVIPMIVYLTSVHQEQIKYDKKKQQLKRTREEKNKAYQDKRQENIQKYDVLAQNSQKTIINDFDKPICNLQDINYNIGITYR